MGTSVDDRMAQAALAQLAFARPPIGAQLSPLCCGESLRPDERGGSIRPIGQSSATGSAYVPVIANDGRPAHALCLRSRKRTANRLTDLDVGANCRLGVAC